MTTALATRAEFDEDAILRSLGIDRNDVRSQTLLVICRRYNLDPIMKHVVLISGRPYISRDGLLHVAHMSGLLDGIEIVDEGEDGTHWWAKVAVFRKDMGRPFTYRGRYPKSGTQKAYGPEMAIKCAEVMALRRAFDVTGVGVAEEMWDTPESAVVDAQRAERVRVAADVKALPEDRKVELREWCTSAGVPLVVKDQTDDQFDMFAAMVADLAGRADDDITDAEVVEG